MVLLESVLSFLLLSVCLIDGESVPEEKATSPLEAADLTTVPTLPTDTTNATPQASEAPPTLADDDKSTTSKPVQFEPVPFTPPPSPPSQSDKEVSPKPSLVTNVLKQTRKLLGKVTETLKKVLGSVSNQLKNLLKLDKDNPVISNLIGPAVDKVKALFNPVDSPIANSLKKVIGPVIGKLKNLFRFDKNKGNPVINALKKLVDPVIAKVTTLLKPDDNPIVNSLKKLIGPVVDKLKSFVVINGDHPVSKLFNNLINRTIDGLKSLAQSHNSTNGNPVVNVLKNVLTPATDFVNTINQPYDSDGNTVIDLFRRFINANTKLYRKIFKNQNLNSDGGAARGLELPLKPTTLEVPPKPAESQLPPKPAELQLPLKPGGGPSMKTIILNHFINFFRNIFVPPGHGLFGTVKMLSTEPGRFLGIVYRQFLILVTNILTPYVPRPFIDFLTKLSESDSSNSYSVISPQAAPSENGTARGLEIAIKPVVLVKVSILTHFLNFLKNIFLPPGYGPFGFFKIIFTRPLVFVRNIYVQFVILVRNVATPFLPRNVIVFLTKLLPQSPQNNNGTDDSGLQTPFNFIGPLKDILNHFVTFLINVISPPEYGTFGFFKIIFTHPVVFVKNVYTQFIILARNVLTPLVPSNFIGFLTRLSPNSTSSSAPNNTTRVISPQPAAPSNNNKGVVFIVWRIVVTGLTYVRQFLVMATGNVGTVFITIVAKLISAGLKMLVNLIPWPVSIIIQIILGRTENCPYFNNEHPIVVFVKRNSLCVSDPLGRIWTLVSQLIKTEVNLFSQYGIGTFFGAIRHIILIKIKIMVAVVLEGIRFLPCIVTSTVMIFFTSLRCVLRWPF